MQAIFELFPNSGDTQACFTSFQMTKDLHAGFNRQFVTQMVIQQEQNLSAIRVSDVNDFHQCLRSISTGGPLHPLFWYLVLAIYIPSFLYAGNTVPLLKALY